MHYIVSFVFVLLITLFNTTSTAETQAVKAPAVATLQSHEATYSVELAEGQQQELVEASGDMKVKFLDVGSGWVTEQSSTITMLDGSGNSLEVNTRQATWEAKDGSEFRFRIRTVKGDGEEVVSGSAQIDPITKAGTVTYEQPELSTVKLPENTMFPVHHLQYTLACAKRGLIVSNAKVFDGSSETKGAVDISAIVARSTEPGELTQKLLKATKSDPSWPIEISVFSEVDQAMEPDYKISQKILESGVIENMTLDYPKMNYRLRAKLKSVKILKKL